MLAQFEADFLDAKPAKPATGHAAEESDNTSSPTSEVWAPLDMADLSNKTQATGTVRKVKAYPMP